MDLCEVTGNFKRHPWELARVNTLAKILEMIEDPESISRVLDVGCGDGFIANNVLKELPVERIDGIDINLRDSEIKKLSSLYNDINFHNTFETIKTKKYNLILLLDVLEHIEDDISFLVEIIEKYVDLGGYCLVTVPAFNCMFSSHDLFLRHYRRYNLKELMGLINNVHLKSICCGYLFFSLIPIRLISLWYERFTKVEFMANKGAGVWKYGMIITRTIASFLTLENVVSITLRKFGITIPGLTVWTLCKKQRL
jgi:SAM-dependent methyltransferase